jgi:hypothetical protein
MHSVIDSHTIVGFKVAGLLPPLPSPGGREGGREVGAASPQHHPAPSPPLA